MSKVPFKCPVCEGRGQVPSGFYTGMGGVVSTVSERCQTCHGTGIIWGVGTQPDCFTSVSDPKDMVQVQEKV